MKKPKLSLKRRLLRLFLWLAGIALAFFLYGELLGPQTTFYIMAHYLAYKDSTVNIVPRPLTGNTVSQSPGTTLSYYGNTFEVPWRSIVVQKVVSKIALVEFASGQSVMVWAPMGRRGILNDAVDDKQMGEDWGRALGSADLMRTPYDQKSAVLNVTTSDLKFLDPPRDSLRTFYLLLFKELGEIESSTGIYTFQSGAARGFQLGNPAKTWRTRLDFFDSTGNSLGEIVCWLGKDASARGTQAEINRIIQTFHPIASTPNSPALARVPPNSPSHAVSPATY